MAAPVLTRNISARSLSDGPVLAREASRDARPRKIRVVLLDDEPSILKTWTAILEAHDFEVIGCERPADALAAIARGCDCLLTDYHMPEMTGIEVMLAARLYTDATFLIMTGNDSPRLRAAATAAGAAAVLAKPAPIKTVIEVIEKLCGKASC